MILLSCRILTALTLVILEISREREKSRGDSEHRSGYHIVASLFDVCIDFDK